MDATPLLRARRGSASPLGRTRETRTLTGFASAVVVMSLVLSLLATLYPSWRAARLDPVQALRYG